MILKSRHPWANYLYARKLVIDWFVNSEHMNFQEIAKTLSMDPAQVELIYMTEVERD